MRLMVEINIGKKPIPLVPENYHLFDPDYYISCMANPGDYKALMDDYAEKNEDIKMMAKVMRKADPHSRFFQYNEEEGRLEFEMPPVFPMTSYSGATKTNLFQFFAPKDIEQITSHLSSMKLVLAEDASIRPGNGKYFKTYFIGFHNEIIGGDPYPVEPMDDPMMKIPGRMYDRYFVRPEEFNLPGMAPDIEISSIGSLTQCRIFKIPFLRLVDCVTLQSVSSILSVKSYYEGGLNERRVVIQETQFDIAITEGEDSLNWRIMRTHRPIFNGRYDDFDLVSGKLPFGKSGFVTREAGLSVFEKIQKTVLDKISLCQEA